MALRPTLHIFGLPHTVTTDEYSHCAFTGKVKRFGPMMRSVGYQVVHYGVEGADSGCDEQVTVLQRDEWEALMIAEQKKKDPNWKPSEKQFVGDLGDTGTVLYQTFNARLREKLKSYLSPRDIMCLAFGHAHGDAYNHFPSIARVETGIGYPTITQKHCVFESNAWKNFNYGVRKQNGGDDYWWVIPNYFDTSAWKLGDGKGKYLLFFGRLIDSKGLRIVSAVARARPDLEVILCGQGDPTPFLEYPNMHYHPPVHGAARSDLVGNALAMIVPSRYIEPFAGVAVESMLCGTPVLTSAFGAFEETVVDEKSGFRCHTLGDYLAGLERIEQGALWERWRIQQYAQESFDMLKLAHKYDNVFQQVTDLAFRDGWYSHRSRFGPVTKAVKV